MNPYERERPLWRSLLFVPVNVRAYVDKAHTRGADGIILDLEDSVPLAEKANARGMVAEAAKLVSRNGADVLVDRKSVVEGKGGSVRVDLGGRRIIKKKKHKSRSNHEQTK